MYLLWACKVDVPQQSPSLSLVANSGQLRNGFPRRRILGNPTTPFHAVVITYSAPLTPEEPPALMPESAESQRSGSPRSSRRRNYQACLECKKQKTKCQLGNSEPPQPPCSRCRRARLNCVFGPARRIRTRVGKAFPSPPNCLGENAGTAASADDERLSAPRSENGANYARSSQFDRSLANNERNEHGEADPSAQLAYDLSLWMLFPLCRDGCISPLEADHLFGYFVQWIHPLQEQSKCTG